MQYYYCHIWQKHDHVLGYMGCVKLTKVYNFHLKLYRPFVPQKPLEAPWEAKDIPKRSKTSSWKDLNRTKKRIQEYFNFTWIKGRASYSLDNSCFHGWIWKGFMNTKSHMVLNSESNYEVEEIECRIIVYDGFFRLLNFTCGGKTLIPLSSHAT